MSVEHKEHSKGGRLSDIWEMSRNFILLALVLAAIVMTWIFNWEDPDPPTATRLAWRINHNISQAQLWTQEFPREGKAHDLEKILSIYDRSVLLVRVSLVGGEIEGVPIAAVQSQALRSEMEEIGRLVGQIKNTTNSFLSLDAGTEGADDIARLLGSQYQESKKLTSHLITSSTEHLAHHRKVFQLFQIILVVLATGFFLAIVLHYRKVQTEKYQAVNLMGQSEERRKLALEGANLGTWDWDLNSGAVVFNKRWQDMLGLEGQVESTFKFWEKLIHPDDLPRFLLELNASLSGESTRLYSEYRMWAIRGHWIWVLALGKVLERDAEGNPLRAAGTHLDITHRKIIELELKREKERAQKYLDLAGGIFVALDAQGIVTMINRKGCQVLGYPEEYIVGKNWIENFVPKRIQQTVQRVAHGLLYEKSVNNEHAVNSLRTAEGKEVLVAWHNVPLHNGEGKIIGHLSSGADITQQHMHELSLEKYRQRLQSLAAQLAMTEDHLRQDIASGLHDSIGQNLAALKLSIDLMGMSLDSDDELDPPSLRKEISRISKNIDHVVQETWSLSFQLSPPGLYESGLRSALEWLVNTFNQEYECEFFLTQYDYPFPAEKDGRGLLFQMIRELMINAAKHGSASEVNVSLSGEDNLIRATVVDNGSGFDTDSVLGQTGDVGGFGLFSIRERLAYISGTLEIESVMGQGTQVVISFPTGNTESAEMELVDES